MLEGTDLMAAYQTLGAQQANYEEQEYQQQPAAPAKKERIAEVPVMNKQFDGAGAGTNSYEADQKIAALVAELKKKKSASAAAAPEPSEPGYFEKLFAKKKELYKVLQLSLIITLGLSVHFLIDHYLVKYLAENEMSFERQLLLRALYPAAVLFTLWNLRVFVK
jgi:hypothetical protein